MDLPITDMLLKASADDFETAERCIRSWNLEEAGYYNDRGAWYTKIVMMIWDLERKSLEKAYNEWFQKWNELLWWNENESDNWTRQHSVTFYCNSCWEEFDAYEDEYEDINWRKVMRCVHCNSKHTKEIFV